MSADPRPSGRDRWISAVDGRPPLFLTGLFCCAVGLVIASVAVDLGFIDIAAPGWSAVTMASVLVGTVVVVAVWPFLRWSRDVAWPRKLLSAAFGGFVFLLLSIGGWSSVVLMALAVVHIAYVFGVRGGVGYSALLTAVAFGISYAYRGSLITAIVEAATSAVFTLWAVAVAQILLSQQRHAAETRRLLAERTAAHAELREYAKRVRELTISEERARMSREMHDSVGHYLTVIGLGLRNAQRYHDTGLGDAWAEIGQAERLTAEALADTRRWVKALRPLALDGRSGADALAALAASFGEYGFNVDFTAEADLSRLSADAELVLYRALQEALTNVVRHSRADRVVVEVADAADGVVLAVTDDGSPGPGIEAGLGIQGLRQRAAAVGGSVEARAVDEGGFRLRLSLPAKTRAAVTPS